METGGDADARQRPLLGEALLELIEHGHFARRPLHAEPALVGQSDVLDIVVVGHGKTYLLSMTGRPEAALPVEHIVKLGRVAEDFPVARDEL